MQLLFRRMGKKTGMLSPWIVVRRAPAMLRQLLKGGPNEAHEHDWEEPPAQHQMRRAQGDGLVPPQVPQPPPYEGWGAPAPGAASPRPCPQLGNVPGSRQGARHCLAQASQRARASGVAVGSSSQKMARPAASTQVGRCGVAEGWQKGLHRSMVEGN